MNEIKNTFYLDEVISLKNNDANLLVSISEEIYRSQIKELTENLLKQKNVKIVLIAGPSSSGKTTTSMLIKQELKKHKIKSVTVSLDDFFLNRDETPKLENGNYDFENITALDINYLNVFVDDLFEKKKAKMPIFDFITGSRKKDFVNLEIDEKTVVIIEGIHALNPTLITKHTDCMFKIYICVNSNFNEGDNVVIPAQKVRMMRRLIRDYYNRGRTVDATISTWEEVLHGEDMYIKPYKTNADYIVDSTHMYEPLLQAKHLMPLLNEATQTETVVSLKNMLSRCEKLDRSIIPKNSLLHEFL